MGNWSYNPYKWSYNPTYNWFLGPPCTSEMHPNLGWTHETFIIATVATVFEKSKPFL